MNVTYATEAMLKFFLALRPDQNTGSTNISVCFLLLKDSFHFGSNYIKSSFSLPFLPLKPFHIPLLIHCSL